ncbi:KH domain-containing protein [bacterium]|nr:KH domain-containing protein [bacterium]
MKAFIEYVVKALVDHPEEVQVTEVDGERVVVFELRLNQGDIGKVIGKSGRTITAIRTLLTSAAAKQGKRSMIEIIEPGGRRRDMPAEEPPAEPGGETPGEPAPTP